MASIGTDSNGRKRILFVSSEGSRKTIRIGRASRKQAVAFKVKVESLVSAGITGCTDDETARWMTSLDDLTHNKLAAVGLLRARQTTGAATLKRFLDDYISSRTDVKPNTIIGLGQARRNLLAFFNESKRLSDITSGDAEEYSRYLYAKLSPNTVRRLCGRAKQFFRFAVKKRIIQSNPFEELESNVRSNPDRRFFITAEMACRVLDACPDAEWRLIFCLSRFGGLRCPSEHLALKWSDVDWERGRLRVPSPKTEHIEGRASRTIPLFPELRKALLVVFEEAPEGGEYVITRYRQPNSNLRTHLQRIIQRAGLESWPKLFHNLRATRQTELAEIFPAHVVCTWLGNTEDVAKAHYLQVTDNHFAKALKIDAVTTEQIPQKAGITSPYRTGLQRPISAAQIPAQHPAERTRTDQHRQIDFATFPGDSGLCESVRSSQWPLSESNRYAGEGGGF